MENEHVTMLGHSTGRLLLQREAYKINLEKDHRLRGADGDMDRT